MNPRLERLYWQSPYALRKTFLKIAFPQRYRKLQALRRAAPFVENKCIFVHIPKTAGISVNMGLFGTKTGAHRKIAGYQAIFSRLEYETYFKFAFVRNPWDRVASAYFFLKEGGLHVNDRRWAAKHLDAYPTFESFVRGWLKPENIRLGHHFVPQADYLCLPGKRVSELDFIGSFETLHADYDYVRSVLGTGKALPKKNVTTGKHKDFRSYYTARTQAIVADVYREDIELLGYTFHERLREGQAGEGSSCHIRPRPRILGGAP